MWTGTLAGALFVMLIGVEARALQQRAEEAAEERVHELRKEKRFKEALAYLDLAVQENPRSGNLRGLYSWIHLLDLKDPKAALDHALRLKQDLPRHPSGYYWSAKAYEAAGDYAKCVATLDDYLPYGTQFSRDNLKAGCHYKNGRWLIYASTDSGRSQVYLAPFPAMDRKWSISTRGGSQPRWSRTRREVFYRDGDRMMSVAVDTSGPEPRLSAPELLFEREFASGAYVTIANYDVTPDGAFIMAQAEPGAPRLTVVLHWFEELKAKVSKP